MKPYWYVRIPWSEIRSPWHPTEKEGPFSTLSTGVFASPDMAHAWAKAHLLGTQYTVVFVPPPYKEVCEAIAEVLSTEQSGADAIDAITALLAEVGIEVVDIADTADA